MATDSKEEVLRLPNPCHGHSREYPGSPSSSAVGQETEESTPAGPEADSSRYSKPCDLCQRRRNVLIRCQIDETEKWHFICTGKCWQDVSGGKQDGDQSHPLYRYGGMWKNKHEAVSAKIKGKAKTNSKETSNADASKLSRAGRGGKSTKVRKGRDDIKREVDGRDKLDRENSDYPQDDVLDSSVSS